MDMVTDSGGAKDLVMTMSNTEFTTLSRTHKFLANNHNLTSDVMSRDLRDLNLNGHCVKNYVRDILPPTSMSLSSQRGWNSAAASCHC